MISIYEIFTDSKNIKYIVHYGRKHLVNTILKRLGDKYAKIITINGNEYLELSGD